MERPQGRGLAWSGLGTEAGGQEEEDRRTVGGWQEDRRIGGHTVRRMHISSCLVDTTTVSNYMIWGDEKRKIMNQCIPPPLLSILVQQGWNRIAIDDESYHIIILLLSPISGYDLEYFFLWFRLRLDGYYDDERSMKHESKILARVSPSHCHHFCSSRSLILM